MARNFSGIWSKFAQYDETNTLMISPFSNTIEEFQRNDLLIPNYSPLAGSETDLVADTHLGYTEDYIKFLAAMEETLGSDMRKLMEAFPYESFLTRINKNLNTAAQTHGKHDNYF